jgi:hypothetical protein
MLKLIGALALVLVAAPGRTETPAADAELRAEIARLRETLARAEALLHRMETERAATVAAAAPVAAPPAAVATASAAPNDKPVPPAPPRPPALNTPPKLPPSDPENYEKAPPRIDVLLQTRYDHFLDQTRNSTFFLRKAEVGLKGNIAPHIDFSVELDLVRVQANDPYRRTYIRSSHLRRLHVKAGLEKAPLGLEELISTAQQPFVDRSEVSDRFSAAEELGIFTESSWDRFMVQTSLTNGGRRLHRDDNRAKAFTARAVWAPLPRLTIGAATMQGVTGPQELARRRYNVEAKYGSTNIRGAQGEFYRAKDGSVWSNAFYVQTYWAVPVKASFLTHVMPVARFENIDRDDDNVASELRVLTLGGGLLLKENRAKLLFNWLTDIREGNPRKDEFRAQYQVEF